MNLIEFTEVLSNPSSVSKEQTRGLDQILEEYPYFQAGHFLRLYAFKKQKSFRYNDALKKTAAYTTDRELLFNYVTSFDFEAFAAAPTDLPDQKGMGDFSEALAQKSKDEPEGEEFSAPATEGEGEKEIKLEKETESFQVGKPLDFKRDDSYSFGEWLQLSQLKPIDRSSEGSQAPETRKSNMDLINEFIAKSPRITVSDSDYYNDAADESSSVNEQLMTETLAHVYVEQKKYEKAIAAFTVLSLKYPEKSSFFADRIEAVRKLQNN